MKALPEWSVTYLLWISGIIIKVEAMRKINCVIYEDDGQFVAHCLNTGVATQGDSYEEAVRMIKEAVELYFEDEAGASYIPISSVTLTEQYINA